MVLQGANYNNFVPNSLSQGKNFKLTRAHSTGQNMLLHSYSTNDATLGEYKHTVTVGHHNIKITGDCLDLVRVSTFNKNYYKILINMYIIFSFSIGCQISVR